MGRAADWIKSIIPSSAFQLSEKDIVVFVVGPSGSGKSTFVRAVTQAPDLVEVSKSLKASAKKVQAIRCELTEAAQQALGNKSQQNIVFVDTPSFLIDPTENTKAVKEMSTWLKKSGFKSTCFGTIYIHRIEMDPRAEGQYCVQKQLDTFVGTFPQDSTTRAFPQRVRCVFTCMDKPKDEKIAKNKEAFQKQLDELRPKVVSWGRLTWKPVIHPGFLPDDDAHKAWEVVEQLFSPLGKATGSVTTDQRAHGAQ